ncbi:MAG: phenylpyruvate tautomerase MIF-related protein [Spirochaetota bacterium]|nr:phenylpyruvate tautomerase MIF-related protein [Spirochaetota bacterium]
MPYLKIQTNAEVKDKQELLKKLSSAAASGIGKPEAYIMTAFSYMENMTFGGTEEPTVFIECKSIGLKEEQTAGLSALLCSFCKDELNVPVDRVYIEFASAKGIMWGFDGRTF